MSDAYFILFACTGVAAAALSIWLARRSVDAGLEIELAASHYALGEMIEASVSMSATRSCEIDEALVTLFCEEKSTRPDDAGRSENWRRLFSKSQMLRRGTKLAAGERLRFCCGMALPVATPDQFKRDFTLSDMAKLMREQLNGRAPMRIVGNTPSDYAGLLSRFGLDDIFWRLEVALLSGGETVAVQRCDIPVEGFGGRRASAHESNKARAA